MNVLMKNSTSVIIFLLSTAVWLDAQTHFAFTSNTGNDMTVVIPASITPTIDGVALANGDEIGVFTPEGLCVGATVWNGSNIAIPVHGDNDRTTIVDGIAAGEQLLFRVWDASLSKEGAATIAYASGGPNYSGDGVAALSSLAASTSSSSSYRVTYDGNGHTSGILPTNIVSYLQGATVTVWDNTGSLAKTGSTFTGWNTAASGSGTAYAGGGTFLMPSSDVTLYARWTAGSYGITFDKNDAGSTGTMSNQTIVYNSTANLTANAFTKAGWSFAGWATTSGGAVAYADQALYSMGAANVTLYAKWTANTYVITFDKNDAGATGTMSNQTIACGSTANLSANAFAKTGWSFAGWATTPDGAVISADQAPFTMGAANLTLYARWTQPHAVTYNGNGNTDGTAPTDATPHLPGVTVTVLNNSNGLSRTGYTFNGWNTASNGSGTSYPVNTTFAMPATDVTLYAQWTLIPTYSVTYNGNGNTGGTVPVDANNYQQGASVPVLGNTGYLAKTGFTFAGWNTAVDGSATSYAAGATFSMGSSNAVLFTQWTVNSYSLTINKVIGQNAPIKIKDTTLTYGDTAHVTAPAVAGILFLHWGVTAGGALLLDSALSTCRVVLQNGNAEITAFCSYPSSILGMNKRIPTDFEFACSDKTGMITFGIPGRPGLSAIHVQINKYDLQGRILGCIIDKDLSPGYYTASVGVQGKTTAGILIYCMESREYRSTVKILSK